MSANPDIDAILWDFGGVITTSPFEAFNRYEAERGLPRDFIRGVNATNPRDNAWARFESGSITLAEFDTLFAEEATSLGHHVPGRDVIARLFGDVRPRMVEVLKACKAHYRIGCITNNMKPEDVPKEANWTEPGGQRAADVAAVMSLFDVVVESSVEGIRKPDPRIYGIACARMGVAADRAVFLDDLGINLKPAKEMGMRTIKVLNEAQAIADLEEVTGLSFG